MLKSLPPNVPILLDGKPVEKITAFLFPKGGHENPKVLTANAGKSFVGSYVLGMGFTFDDTSAEATSLAEMQRLITENPNNQERIFPYIGGSEVNSSPTHEHHRYVINFGEMSEDEAREWPELIAIVEEKVRGTRGKHSTAPWWQFERLRGELFEAIESCDQVLVAAQTSKYKCFTFLPKGYVYDQKLVVFALDSFSAFAVMHARTHENWVLFFGSSLEDRPVYTPSDCFETFPFPEGMMNEEVRSEKEDHTIVNSAFSILNSAGKAYYNYRAALMIRNNQGLTDTYNRFHDPQETNPEILHLRDLHHQMDRAVLTAYGWDTLETPCGFALDYLDLDQDKLPSQVQDRMASGDLFFSTTAEATAFDNLIQSTLKTRKKLPWRYRWSPGIHDEILARLLDLNQQRYDDETLRGKKEKGRQKKESKKQTKPKASKNAIPQADKQIALIPEPIEQLDVWSTMDPSDT